MLPRKHFFLVVFLLSSLCSSAGDFGREYGLGCIQIEPYNFFSLEFFNFPNENTLFNQVTFTADDKTHELHFQFATTGQDTIPYWFHPEYFHIEKSAPRIEMFCIEQQGDWYRVIVNDSTRASRWIKNGADIKLLGWPEFFKNVPTISIVSGDPFLYEKASAKSKHQVIKTASESGGSQLIQIQKIQDEWMYVSVISFSYNMDASTKVDGWIKWHDDDVMFISYNRSH